MTLLMEQSFLQQTRLAALLVLKAPPGDPYFNV